MTQIETLLCLVRLCTPIILAVRRLRKEDYLKFETSLNCTVGPQVTKKKKHSELKASLNYIAKPWLTKTTKKKKINS